MKRKQASKKPVSTPPPPTGDWRENASVFASSAQTHYENVRHSFLELAATDPSKAIQEYGREVVQAQVVHENMQVVQTLLDEANTALLAFQLVQKWITTVTVEAVAEFQKSFATDLTGTCRETAISYRLQLLQTDNSPLNRLLKQLSGMS